MQELPNLKDMPNRCISCSYLCYLEGYAYREIVNTSRKSILDKTLAKILCLQLRCYKNHLSDMYNSSTKSKAEEAMIKVSQATCPEKDWRLHHDGIAPEVSYQREQRSKSFRWTKTGVIIAIIGVIATLIVLGLTIYSVFCK